MPRSFSRRNDSTGRSTSAATRLKLPSTRGFVVRSSGRDSLTRPKNFRGLQSLKTHNLDILVRLSGVEARGKTRHLAEWSAVLDWNPEKRYQPIGKSTPQQATDMVTSAKRLLEVL